MAFFNGIGGLNEVLGKGGPGAVVHQISIRLMGAVGGIIAILGVIVCPITSGDTAFRSARLTIADSFNIPQNIKNRLIIAIPLFAVGLGLNFINFNIIWRYFAFSNQSLATVVLWAGAVYLAKNAKFHWIATLPATFMTAVCVTYILIAPEGFKLSTDIAYPAGIAAALIAFALFIGYIFPKESKMIRPGD